MCDHTCAWLQVEERLRFYDEGVAPRKNATVMAAAMQEFKDTLGSDDEEGAPAATPVATGDAMDVDSEAPTKKGKKKSKAVRAHCCDRPDAAPVAASVSLCAAGGVGVANVLKTSTANVLHVLMARLHPAESCAVGPRSTAAAYICYLSSRKPAVGGDDTRQRGRGCVQEEAPGLGRRRGDAEEEKEEERRGGGGGGGRDSQEEEKAEEWRVGVTARVAPAPCELFFRWRCNARAGSCVSQGHWAPALHCAQCCSTLEASSFSPRFVYFYLPARRMERVYADRALQHQLRKRSRSVCCEPVTDIDRVCRSRKGALWRLQLTIACTFTCTQTF